MNFKLLTVKKGACGKLMKEFKEGKFMEWGGGGEEFDVQKWECMHDQLKGLYLESWAVCFDDSNSLLRVFLFFSMNNF